MKNKKAPKQFITPVRLGESQKSSQGFPSKDGGRGFFFARRHLARFNVSSFTPTFNFFQKTRVEFLTDLIFYVVVFILAVSTVRGCEDSTDRDYVPMNSYLSEISRALDAGKTSGQLFAFKMRGIL